MATIESIDAFSRAGSTHAELLARASALAPQIGARSAAAHEAAEVPHQTINDITEAGLFRAFQPREWGGLELDPRVMLDLQNVFAEQCLSTAWVFGVLSVQAFLLGRLDPRAQADVWGDNPDMLVSSSFAPVGKVTPAEGGFRISGRFTFSSGSTYAGWAMVGGMAPPAEGSPAPQMRLFLVPRSDYRIDQVWDTIGLRGTGSNDLVLEDVFVPEYRSYAPDGGLLPLAGDAGLDEMYRLPWLHMFTSMVANVGIGAGRAALASFTDVTRTRRGGPTNAASRDNPAFLAVIGRARATIDMLDQNAKHNFSLLLDKVARDEALPLEQALVVRSQLTGSLRQIAALVDEMMLLLGGRGIRSDGPLTRIWLDLAAARAHPGNDPGMIYGQLAGEMLGQG